MDSNKMFGIFPRKKYTTKILRKEEKVKYSITNDPNENKTNGKKSNNSPSGSTPSIVRPYNKRKQKPISTTIVTNNESAIVPVTPITTTMARNSVSEENSSCNIQFFRCQLVNDQKYLFNDQTVRTYELQPIYVEPNIRNFDGMITTPTSSCTVPIVSTFEQFDGATNTNNSNFTTVAMNEGVNNQIITSDVEIIHQDSFESNAAKELNDLNDAEFAFGRSVAMMLKKIENVGARLGVQAKIYEVLSTELKVNT